MRPGSEVASDGNLRGNLPPVGNLAGYLEAVLGADGVDPAHRLTVALSNQQVRENRLIRHVQRKSVSVSAAFSANAAA